VKILLHHLFLKTARYKLRDDYCTIRNGHVSAWPRKERSILIGWNVFYRFIHGTHGLRRKFEFFR
jgi:hypothetical protein